jgi:hypothetical protein
LQSFELISVKRCQSDTCRQTATLPACQARPRRAVPPPRRPGPHARLPEAGLVPSQGSAPRGRASRGSTRPERHGSLRAVCRARTRVYRVLPRCRRTARPLPVASLPLCSPLLEAVVDVAYKEAGAFSRAPSHLVPPPARHGVSTPPPAPLAGRYLQ